MSKGSVIFPDTFGMLVNTALIAREMTNISPRLAAEVAPALGYALACREATIDWGEAPTDWESVCFDIARIAEEQRDHTESLRYFPAPEATDLAHRIVHMVLSDAGVVG